MARYFRREPSDKSDCGGDETEEKKSGLNFTPHAPCQFAAAIKRAKVPRGPPPTAIQRRAQQKDSEQGPARKCQASDKKPACG